MSNSEAAALLLTLGARAAEARRRLGLSQEKLAERMGISPGYVRRIERGRENLTVKSIAKLAESLGLTLRDLLAP